MRLNDNLSGPDWQRVRNAQLSGEGEADPTLPPLSDQLPMDTWQLVRGRQVTGSGFSNGKAAQEIQAPPEFDVDRGFLAEREGTRRDMYVPTDKKGHVIGQSGPTIGVGVDLGRKDVAYLKSLGIGSELVDRLTPYLGKQRDEALKFVNANPLILSDADLNALNSAVQDRELRKVAAKFDAASQVGPFARLPRNTQTAIGSLYFQYGTDAPDKATPNYWRQITSGDWQGALRNLRKFGDAYQPRRDLEAKILQEDIESGKLDTVRPKGVSAVNP